LADQIDLDSDDLDFPIPADPTLPTPESSKELADRIDLDAPDVTQPTEPNIFSSLPPAAENTMPPTHPDQTPVATPIPTPPAAPAKIPPLPSIESTPPATAEGLSGDLDEHLFGDLTPSESKTPVSDITGRVENKAAQESQQEAPEVSDPFDDLQIDTAPSSPMPELPSSESSPDSGDDPFAASTPPAKPEAAGSDSFYMNSKEQGDQLINDPFAGSGQDDPFATDDSQSTQGDNLFDVPTPIQESSDNPFECMDNSEADDGQTPMSDQDMSSGLDLDTGGYSPEMGDVGVDLSGQVVGEPPPIPKPVKQSPAGIDKASKPAAPQAPIATEPTAPLPPAKTYWIYKLGFGIIAICTALLLFVTYRSGGSPDFFSWSTYANAFTGNSTVETVITNGLYPINVKSTAYRNRYGHPLIVMWGEIQNRAKDKQSAIAVQGQLRDAEKRTLGDFTAPAGISFSAQEIFEMTDSQAITNAYHTKLPEVANLDLLPNTTTPFMLILYDHPNEFNGMQFIVTAEPSQDPYRGLGPSTENESDEEKEPATVKDDR
jgi:hypothetical protein